MQSKKIFVALALLGAMSVVSKPMFAQEAAASPTAQASVDQDIKLLRSDVQAGRKALTAENMNLTTYEATKFWPVYDQYVAETAKIGDARTALIKDYAAQYDTMTDAQANSFIKRAATIDRQVMDVRMKYVPLFEKVVSAKKTALWFQIDRRLDLLINLQLADNIPMVDTTAK